MPRLTVDLPDLAFRHLQAVALAERRPIRDQAAVLLERGILRRAARRAVTDRPEPQPLREPVPA